MVSTTPDSIINIRGISSVNAGSGPLIVVDGQPMPDGMSSVNNADVESVEVLKMPLHLWF
jgi:outer membrane receptor protein involved in Fe transport